ncbi:MAG TPA: hypothetical protein VLH83_03430 [Chthoniobacterales bacterium]|nr:hypothetical protein [Chthoniobacterales bacterium]
MFAVIELGRSRDEIRDAGKPHIGFKNFIRVVEVTQDEIETAEVAGQLRGQLGVSGEKSGERSRFNRADRIGVEASFGKRGNVFGAEDFDVRVGIMIAEQSYRGQGEDEIADGAAADDQDPVQVSSA